MSVKKDIYLDNSATTRCFPEVAALMSEIYLEDYGNPSSMHHRGVTAERRVAQARQTLASILKVKDKNSLLHLLRHRVGQSGHHRGRAGGAEEGKAPDHDADRASGGPGGHEISGVPGI